METKFILKFSIPFSKKYVVYVVSISLRKHAIVPEVINPKEANF